MNRVDLEERLKNWYDKNLSSYLGEGEENSMKWVISTLESCNWTFQQINNVPGTFASYLEKILVFFELVINKFNNEETKKEIDFALQMFIRNAFYKNWHSIRSMAISLTRPRKQTSKGRPNIYVSDRYHKIINNFFNS